MRLVDLDDNRHQYVGYNGSYQCWNIDPRVNQIDSEDIEIQKVQAIDRELNVLIAVPTFENILPDTFKSIWRLRNSICEPSFDFIRGYDCAKARNEIAKRAIKDSFDYVLMVDSDIIIPEHTLDAMLQGRPDICLGVYPVKNTHNGMAELFKHGDKFKTRFKYAEFSEDEPRIDVKGGGFGCALIKTEVLRQLKYPYFRFVAYDSGSYLSEDLYFCLEASKAGFKIEADTRVQCDHSIRGFQYK